ncbi:hypothetical protein ACWGHM_37125 [Streptomyces sp. NPDC054904]
MLSTQAFGLALLVRDVPQAFLKVGDLAEPLQPSGFIQSLVVLCSISSSRGT